ncbi:VIT1/CCC1 transporter family protein [Mycobacterium montefiorense]|uniref:Membrane protein n=1 Tax=Mycobacterium montefiorense TaxID=154654 RepID=A0AA37UWY4_9MYCO|nr:VIT family protein [Mycobacterium montefiorense]GBG36976.1 membrane protein [Mycobacterium montefiorense]GKU32887.1 membrane protein [Mycobacterium montefiorense]GKU42564.1 membrane protein [Mycobacterium montefiorense]GKU48279.1 membrane protein [Mycobacterium montefiorense]GKU50781.1 membrane protein [Mycobacterium montefiorense]
MSDDRQRPVKPTHGEVDAAAAGEPTHTDEPHADHSSSRLNKLRAAVLGANDGIVSVAALVIGVAGTTSQRGPIFTAGLAALVGGAVSMALGEFVSVSSQRDSETAQLLIERNELQQVPDAELAELAAIYQSRGLSARTAARVAEELTAHDPLTAHAHAELNIDPDDLANPWQAAAASAASFIVGALLPLVAILLPPNAWRVPVTFIAVLAALALTGVLSVRIGGGNAWRAVLRVVLGGAVGLGFTYGIGCLFGTAVH